MDGQIADATVSPQDGADKASGRVVGRATAQQEHLREQKPITALHRNFIDGQSLGVKTGERIKV